MKLTKRILTTAFAVAATIAMATVSASALTAGFSDYGTSETKTVADVAGDTVSLADTTSGSIIDIPKTALPEGVTQVTFAAKEYSTSSEEYKAAARAAQGEGFSNFVVLDLKLFDQDSKSISKLNGKIEITLKVTGDVNTVLYFNDATGKIENLGGTVKNGFITFETDHFSYYMLAKADAAATVTTTAATTTNGVVNPATSDNSMVSIVIFSVMAVLALGTTVVAIKAKKAK